MNGYFAVQLDRSSCNVVKKRATFPNIGAGLRGISSKKVFQMIYHTFL